MKPQQISSETDRVQANQDELIARIGRAIREDGKTIQIRQENSLDSDRGRHGYFSGYSFF